MRDPYRKKQRDLRRAARSLLRPSIYNLFDVYHPEYKKYDRSRDNQDWYIYWNAQHKWVDRIAGGPHGESINSVHRRDRNRLLRTLQKAALSKAFRLGDWDDFVLPKGRRDIRWLYW